jgi:hypothetical protein
MKFLETKYSDICGLDEPFMETYMFLVNHAYRLGPATPSGALTVSYQAGSTTDVTTEFAHLDVEGELHLHGNKGDRSPEVENAISVLREDVMKAGLHYDAHGRTAFHCEGLL